MRFQGHDAISVAFSGRPGNVNRTTGILTPMPAGAVALYGSYIESLGLTKELVLSGRILLVDFINTGRSLYSFVSVLFQCLDIRPQPLNVVSILDTMSYYDEKFINGLIINIEKYRYHLRIVGILRFDGVVALSNDAYNRTVPSYTVYNWIGPPDMATINQACVDRLTTCMTYIRDKDYDKLAEFLVRYRLPMFYEGLKDYDPTSSPEDKKAVIQASLDATDKKYHGFVDFLDTTLEGVPTTGNLSKSVRLEGGKRTSFIK